MTAVRMGWMSICHGDDGAGKSSAVRLLASLCNARLEEVTLSTATDTTELLGCFEQLGRVRRSREHHLAQPVRGQLR